MGEPGGGDKFFAQMEALAHFPLAEGWRRRDPPRFRGINLKFCYNEAINVESSATLL